GNRIRALDDSEGRAALLPGDYRLYLSPLSKILLALEPVVPPAPAAVYRAPFEDRIERRFDSTAIARALAAAHGFDRDYVEHNRRGQLAPGQLDAAIADTIASWVAVSVSLLAALGIILASGNLVAFII